MLVWATQAPTLINIGLPKKKATVKIAEVIHREHFENLEWDVNSSY